ncbi:MAG: hypothetical protein PHV05_00775 [Candidatus Riflebacteria bacterium]|nr:hypothetical protein [Candidatus Riflebacteria bacterium]
MTLEKKDFVSKKIKLDLQAGRPENSSSWDLPVWGHPLSMGVFPLFAVANVTNNAQLIPVGSSFCISNKIGVLVTAEHNIRESLNHHWKGSNLLQRDQLPESFELNDMGLAVFHHSKTGDNTYSANVWPLESLHGAQPTDVIYGFPKFQTQFPILSFPVSFAVPRIGSKITCVGYIDSLPKNGISIDSLKVNWSEVYSHKFRAVEGRVTRIFTQRFTNGYLKGPCIVIDVDLPHGMSGGPAFNEQGHICGVVSAGASMYFNAPAGIVSLLYPTLLTRIEFGLEVGAVRVNAKQTVRDLVAQGAIHTDGSENLFISTLEEGKTIINPMIHKEDRSFVHNDFSGYQAEEQADRR